jgi:hypothetical protein
VTSEGFRRLALLLPEAYESLHMRHPDFRVGKKVFATLSYPDSSYGMVKLTPAQQAVAVGECPDVFAPVQGGWGLRGSTNVRLRVATRATLWAMLVAAWKNAASAALLKRHGELDD